MQCKVLNFYSILIIELKLRSFKTKDRLDAFELVLLWSYYYGNMRSVLHSGVIINYLQIKADKNDNFRICLLQDCIV